MRPLEGVRVLDLSRLLPGPFLTQILADLGADVTKVEDPAGGEFTRHMPPEVDGAGYAFSAVHRGKRSVALDLKRGADVVLRLASRADVLVESFRPGVLAAWGLADERLAAANPRLVRVSLVGYPAGPWRDDVGHDINYLALAGVLPESGPGPVLVADLSGALYGAIAVLAALRERDRTGKGSRVEVALYEAALAVNALALQRREPTSELTGGLAGYRTYRCADGRFVALGALEPKFLQRFVERFGEPTEELFATAPSHAWVERARAAGVPCTPVLAPAEVGVRAGPATPLTHQEARGPVPRLGEHTDAALREAGLSEAEIRTLREAGTIR